MKKTVKNILVLYLSMALFSMTAPLVCGCKPESKDDPEYPEPDPEPTPKPEKLASVLTMKIGETFTIPFTGELLLPYTGIKKGDEIVLTHKS